MEQEDARHTNLRNYDVKMEYMEYKVSVIVPVYNVEKYLPTCVESIISQTWQNIEVILVDDGSTDSSSIICDKYAEQNDVVTVIHKKNGGLSDARNVGLNASSGDYVTFIDSDDFLDDCKAIEEIINRLNNLPDVDVICYNRKNFFQKENILRPLPQYPDSVVNALNKDEAIVALIGSGMFPMSACTKLIRRNFLIKNDIRFIKGITSEDIPWFIEIVSRCNNILFINTWPYVYRRQVETSITYSYSYNKFKSLLWVLEHEIEEVSKVPKNNIKNALLSFLAYEWSILLAQTYYMDKARKSESRNHLKQYKWLLKYDLNPKVKIVRVCCVFMGENITAKILAWYIRNFVNRN